MNLYQSDGKANVWRKDLLMIQNPQAHLWNKFEVISWLGLAWLWIIEWCNQTDWEILHHAARQWPKTHCQNNQGVHQGKVEGFRLTKSISTLKHFWTCILTAKEEPEGRNSLKQLIAERGCKEKWEGSVRSVFCRLDAVIAAKHLQLNMKYYSL